MKWRLGKRSIWLAYALAVSAFSLFGSTSAQAASQAPAWQITQVPRPTNFVPGSSAAVGVHEAPEYELAITNVGGEEAAGTIVTDTLPSGLTATETPNFALSPNPTSTGTSFPYRDAGPCAVAGGTVVTCTLTKPVPAGGTFTVNIPLTVSSSAPPNVTNEVVVEGGGAVGSALSTTTVSATPAPFSIEKSTFSAGVYDEAGNFPPAGSHPFLTFMNIGVSTVEEGLGSVGPSEDPRRIALELPQGLVVNPTATETRCSMQVLSRQDVSDPPSLCPQSSQVGRVYLTFHAFKHATEPIYNMVPPPGVPAALGFDVAGLLIVVQGGLGGNFHLTAKSVELLKKFRVSEATVALWGDPSDERHDLERWGGDAGSPEGCYNVGPCSINQSPKPFVTMPASCTEPLEATATVDSWFGNRVTATVPLSDREFNAGQITGCNQLAFEPTIESRATTNAAGVPAGLDFSIHQPQDESFKGRATAPLKDARVTLPEGLAVNPSAANGLSACTEQQMGYAPEEGKIRFATTPQSCPDAAKVGRIEAKTPLLEKPISGGVYLAKPFDNPFGSLLALYLAVEDEETGIVAKLAGKVEPDPATGQLRATFTDNPELPLEDIDLHFFNGARATLTTPLTCGTKTTTSTLTPWSTPEGIDAHPSGSFETQAGCYGSEAAAPKTVAFSAGTESPLSGAYSPFTLRIARPDGSQHITGIETTLPGGLVGKLAGVSYCPEGGIAQAISREAPEKGKEEQASPSCPAASEVGTVNVTAGSGIAPVPVSGHAYLAGPYKGAPLSMVVIVPAVTGPFDLGTVVNRVALNIGEYDARIHAVADPLPTIRNGIPLDVRSIEVKLSRPGFTLNPTSCEAMAIEGSASTQAGQSAPLKNSFQVGECARLGFKPKLKLSLKGQTRRTGHPALKAVLTYPSQGDYANIASAQVSLPHGEFLDQGNIGAVCTQAQLKANACPPSAVYGTVKVWTPLFDQPLEGNVYLGVGFGHKLPDLVAELNGQVRVLVHGKVDTNKQDGIRNTFEVVPDAPVSKFVLEMQGGKKKGLLVNSENICRKPQAAEANLTAQNGKALKLKVPIANGCKGKHKKSAKKGKKKG